MKTALLDLFTSKKFLTAVSAVAIYIAGRFGFDLDPAALDRIYAAFLVYVGAQGIADQGKSAAKIRAASIGGSWAPASRWETPERDRPEPTRVPGPGTGIGPAVALLVVLGVGALALQPACATVRPRAAAGVGTFLACESPHVNAELLAEAKHVAIAAIDRWISGDGHVDLAGLKSEAAPLKSDLMRCAFDAAIAAIAAPTPNQPGAALAAERTIDGAELLAAHAQVRAELGWPAAQGGV